MASAIVPPSFTSDVSVIRLDTNKSSKITAVSLYFGRAEVTRTYTFSATTGANRLVITNLPEVLENKTLRVEGRGSGLVHDVHISFAEKMQPPVTSETLSRLLSQKEELENAMERSKKCLKGLERYLETLNANHVDAAQLSVIVDNYEATTTKYDGQIMKSKKDLRDVEDGIKAEKARLQDMGAQDSRLRKVANISFFANKEGDFEIRLIYVVTSASWAASYDIRASTQAKDSAFQLVYKAIVSQSTGEDWNEVPLTLETITPSFDTSLPSLTPWKLSIYNPPATISNAKKSSNIFKKSAVKEDAKRYELAEESDDDMGFGLFDGDGGNFGHSQAQVLAKGNLSATFLISGLVTVPTESQDLTLTVQNLDLHAQLSWIAIPKRDTRPRLTAKVTNDSEYPLIPGKANVFVDSTFISSISFPAVSPKETFDCPLGVDPSIRIVYHAREVKSSKSGFYAKSSITVYSQRISIHNSKAASISQLTIVDQIPVSEDSQVSVVLKSPRLSLPSLAQLPAEAKAKPSVVVEDGVTAFWHDSSDSGDITSLGKEGKLKWVCSLAAHKKLDLLLQWEVSFPAQFIVKGMDDG